MTKPSTSPIAQPVRQGRGARRQPVQRLAFVRQGLAHRTENPDLSGSGRDLPRERGLRKVALKERTKSKLLGGRGRDREHRAARLVDEPGDLVVELALLGIAEDRPRHLVELRRCLIPDDVKVEERVAASIDVEVLERPGSGSSGAPPAPSGPARRRSPAARRHGRSRRRRGTWRVTSVSCIRLQAKLTATGARELPVEPAGGHACPGLDGDDELAREPRRSRPAEVKGEGHALVVPRLAARRPS